MEIVRLSDRDVRLLAARRERHGNSFRGMLDALRELGAVEAIERSRALRMLERQLEIDLGELCARVARLDSAGVHPLERRIMEALASWQPAADGERELWIYPARVRELRHLMGEARLVW